MRKISLIAAALAAAFAAPAAAQTWRSVGWAGQAPERFFYFIDVDSIAREGNRVTFAELEILESLEPSGANHVLNYREGDCGSLSTQILRSRYSRDGRVLLSNDEPDEWVVHERGSMMGDGLSMVCGTLAYDSGPIADPEVHARHYFSEN